LLHGSESYDIANVLSFCMEQNGPSYLSRWSMLRKYRDQWTATEIIIAEVIGLCISNDMIQTFAE
jgi:hypothetical protein